MHAGKGLVTDYRSVPSSHGRLFVPMTFLLAGLAVLSTVGAVVLVVALVAAMPTKYLYPDGSCAVVVEYTSLGPQGHDCGWEDGKRHSLEYVGWKADIARLHSRQ